MRIQRAIIVRIENLCQEQGLTVNQLAGKSGLPASTVKNIIYGGSRNTGVKTIAMMCKGLHISLTDFFNHELFWSLDNGVNATGSSQKIK